MKFAKINEGNSRRKVNSQLYKLTILDMKYHQLNVMQNEIKLFLFLIQTVCNVCNDKSIIRKLNL